MTDRYAVIGNPVAHSKSPLIHAEFARQTGQDIAYSAILAPLGGFRATVKAFGDGGGKGLNITIPFKHEAWNLVDRHAGCALEAHAVNTVAFSRGRMTGHNTDGIGLVRDLRDNLGFGIGGKRVLLMGAGGAVYGVMEALLREQPARVVVANRTAHKAVGVIRHFQAIADSLDLRGIAWSPYETLDEAFDLVINATSAGLAGLMPPLPGNMFAPGALAYDMVYGRMTRFLEFARARGAQAVDGTGMLVEQAAESFHIWRGVRPATQPVIARLRGEE